MHRVQALIHPDNTASIHLAERRRLRAATAARCADSGASAIATPA